ncbi:MAG: 2-oxoacid:acceptor oxidoreductase subunit alpha [Methanoregula sp.]|nr:2-oxoacid:acceptor oxidoreductase subunit alpha [Methanoregula sp.]
MKEISVLIGGKAGDGINSAGALVAHLLNHIGYKIYLYFDYPSLIRGGHNFAIIRGSENNIGTCSDKVDFVLALNNETVELHKDKFTRDTVIISNKDLVKSGGQGIPVKDILDAEHAPEIMGNSAIIGGFAKTAGIEWDVVTAVFNAHIPKGVDLNLKVAKEAYDNLEIIYPISKGPNPPCTLITGNEAIGLGLVKGGLDTYVSYPMTPSSSLLHFLADQQEKFGITVVHPENEIAVILIALGSAYAGKRSAVGTSGGGFCLMTEGLSLAGMAELPIVLVVSQRTGPSTGLPTYTGQSDLRFILHAGQGEFPRLIVAPGDAQESMFWSAVAMNIAWKYQIPAFILADKTLSEGTYSIDADTIPEVRKTDYPSWSGTGPYLRYADTPSGISPLAFPGSIDAVIKVNSYAHNESGISVEDANHVAQMAKKRLRKEEGLAGEMQAYPGVSISGNREASTALLCWGSTKGICNEIASTLGMRVIQPIVLSPFPLIQLQNAVKGVKRLIAVEENATGQLAALAGQHGIVVDEKILQYDGRPFSIGDLREKISEMVL